MIGVHSDELIRGISFFTAFFIISYLHIVVGELAPKSWAIRKPELLSLWTAVPLYLFYWLMYPAIWLLNASANAILKIAGQGEPGPHHEHHYSRDELKLILHSSRAQDPSDQGMRVLASAVELGELEVVDWANSREDLVYLEHDAPLADILAVIRRHKYSRYPVWDSHKGEFIGLLHIRTCCWRCPPWTACRRPSTSTNWCARWRSSPSTPRCRACWSSSARAARTSPWWKRPITRWSAS